MYHINGMQKRCDVSSASNLERREKIIHTDLQDQSDSNDDVWFRGRDADAKAGARIELFALEGPN